MIPTACPRCESEQKFVPKLRDTQHRWQEEYIKCTVCRYEQVIRVTTAEIEVVRTRVRKALDRMIWEQRKHGTASDSTMNSWRSNNAELHKLQRELLQEMREHGTAAN